MLGALREALDEATAAVEELKGFTPVHAGAAQHELGEIRLRLGDLDAADEAFRRAHDQGEDPQPGLALLRLDAGTTRRGRRLDPASLEPAASDRFTRAQLLQAHAEIAVEDCDAASARSAAGELADIADRVASPAIRAASGWANGLVAALAGDHTEATRHLSGARDGWSDIGAPFEEAKAEAALAEALLASGDRRGRRRELESAHATFERIGAQLHAARTAEGGAHAVTHGRATRTFLFTDIVGSTSLIEVIGDEAWTDLRRWHDQTLRTSFAEHGGEEIDHAGDGFFVAFADAGSALACAIQIQRRLVEHRRAHGFAPHVRMGLHASEAAQAAGSYAGLGVHAAARIAGARRLGRDTLQRGHRGRARRRPDIRSPCRHAEGHRRARRRRRRRLAPRLTLTAGPTGAEHEPFPNGLGGRHMADQRMPEEDRPSEAVGNQPLDVDVLALPEHDPDRLPPLIRPAVDFIARIRATVHTKLLAAFLVIAVLLLAMGVTSILVIRRMNAQADELLRLQS